MALLLLLAPAAQARDPDARAERVTVVVWLEWSDENLGPSNFSKANRVPAHAWAVFPDDVKQTLRKWWRDPHADVDPIAARRAQETVVNYCLQWNAEVFADKMERLMRDLKRVAPSAHARGPPDGMGVVTLSGVPSDALAEILDLPFVKNVGRHDAAFDAPTATDKTEGR